MENRQILESWKEISAHLRHGVRTCQRWEFELGLPIHRLDGTPKARVYAYTDELDLWIKEKLGQVEVELKTPGVKAEVGRKNFITPALGVLGIVTVALVTWRIVALINTNSSILSAGQPTVAVLTFENKSGDTNLDQWRDGLAELLIADLSQSRYIKVVPGEEMYTILKRLGLADARRYSSEDIEKIAAQCRATYVLRGNFLKAGESFVITAGLQKPGKGENSTTLRFEAHDENDIIPKVDELTRQVKQGLNLSPTQAASDADKEAGTITTASPEALRYYVDGQKRLYNNNFPQTIAYMERAVELDPEFATAYATLAFAHGYMKHDAEQYRYLKKALELSARLPEKERLLIEGQFLTCDQDYAKAVEILGRLVKTYPGYSQGHACLADAYWGTGDTVKAIEQQEIAVQNYKTARGIDALANFYNSAGLYKRAEDVCRSFLQDVGDNEVVRDKLFTSYLIQRKFDLALAEADKVYLIGSQNLKGDKAIVLICTDDFAKLEKMFPDWRVWSFLARGRIHETIELSQQNLEKVKGDKFTEAFGYWILERVMEKNGLYDKAYQAFAQYLKVSAEYRTESSLRYLPSRQKFDLFTRGRIQAEMRSFDEARKTAEELKSLIEKGVNRKELRRYEYILGQIELERGNYRQAADLFGRACGWLDFQGEWSPEQAPYFANLARAFYESGDLDKARKTYERITLLTTGRGYDGDIYARAFYMLGKIAERQGDKARARDRYRKFLDLWKDADPGLPEVPDAKTRLAALKGS
jgi:tetratricopeptide (TPR) repeat protein